MAPPEKFPEVPESKDNPKSTPALPVPGEAVRPWRWALLAVPVSPEKLPVMDMAPVTSSRVATAVPVPGEPVPAWAPSRVTLKMRVAAERELGSKRPRERMRRATGFMTGD